MHKQKRKGEQGFIHIVIIIILLLIVISLLGVSLRSVFSNTLLQDNFGIVGDWFSGLWHSSIATPFRYIVGLLIIPVWNRFLSVLQGGINF